MYETGQRLMEKTTHSGATYSNIDNVAQSNRKDLSTGTSKQSRGIVPIGGSDPFIELCGIQPIQWSLGICFRKFPLANLLFIAQFWLDLQCLLPSRVAFIQFHCVLTVAIRISIGFYFISYILLEFSLICVLKLI